MTRFHHEIVAPSISNIVAKELIRMRSIDTVELDRKTPYRHQKNVSLSVCRSPALIVV